MLTGVVTSVGLVLVGPDVSSNPLEIIPGVELSQPAILSVPLGFLAAYLGTVLSGPEKKAERGFEELHVRSETGLGAEVAIEGASLSGSPPGSRPASRSGATRA